MVLVISEETYRQTWKNNPPALQPSAVKLKTYTGETLTVLGTINVLTQFAGQEEQLDLLVVDGSGPNPVRKELALKDPLRLAKDSQVVM